MFGATIRFSGPSDETVVPLRVSGLRVQRATELVQSESDNMVNSRHRLYLMYVAAYRAIEALAECA